MSSETAVDTQSMVGTHPLRRQIDALGPWFHNLRLAGVETAPHHFLGDYPTVKYERFSRAIPDDLRGKSVLDIGCNAGFYSMEMKRRGAARVLGLDTDERYLRQARFAAHVEGLDIEYRRQSVWDVAALGETFDLVIFMGVLYHLRHPLLALDLIHEHAARDLFLFQSMLRGSSAVMPVEEDYEFFEPAPFDRRAFPKLHFIEQRYSTDVTNWWIPNRACMEAMLRSSGFCIESQPETEVYLCRWAPLTTLTGEPYCVYPPQAPPAQC
jgi:tRNA (mo5U34)-methyltransferase